MKYIVVLESVDNVLLENDRAKANSDPFLFESQKQVEETLERYAIQECDTTLEEYVKDYSVSVFEVSEVFTLSKKTTNDLRTSWNRVK